MKSLKDIGLILLSNRDLFKTGLCRWLVKCYHLGLITEQDWSCVYELLSSEEGFTGIGYFLGESGDIEKRIDWIRKNLIDD